MLINEFLKTADVEWLRERFRTHREEFASIKEGAARMDKSYTTIHRWIASGEVRALRVGGTLWVYLPSLDAKIGTPLIR